MGNTAILLVIVNYDISLIGTGIDWCIQAKGIRIEQDKKMVSCRTGRDKRKGQENKRKEKKKEKKKKKEESEKKYERQRAKKGNKQKIKANQRLRSQRPE